MMKEASHMGIDQLSLELAQHLTDCYFEVVQRHLPFVNKNDFGSTSMGPGSSHNQALVYAVYMAGAHVDGNTHLEEACYVAARYHLENAQRDANGSKFWTLEVAQALILVARYEFTHTKAPKALLTMARLNQLLQILWYNGLSEHSAKTQSPLPTLVDLQITVQERNTHLGVKRIYLAALAMRCRQAFTSIPAVQESDDTRSLSQVIRSRSPIGEEQEFPFCSSLSSNSLEQLDPFSLFALALKIAADVDRHYDNMATDVKSGKVVYNFCHHHAGNNSDIGILVSWLTRDSTSAISSSPDWVLRILAMIIALGARIQLYNTAIIWGERAKFLSPATIRCQTQNVSTAKDISDILLQAEVLDDSKVKTFREAGFFIMPSLALAANAHIIATKLGNSDTVHWYVDHEARKSLETIYTVMEACDDETDRYRSCLDTCKGVLESTHGGTVLRTEFVQG
ncbi:hypothetical protein F5B20DRAFT_565114 [Whalleya microplaca]|nr:hypothetical protein F5B20DRAFT_565114 [Whalleya microplaca]